jgi:hypothetical protein
VFIFLPARGSQLSALAQPPSSKPNRAYTYI